jgi:hypothetical protein
LGDFLIKLGAFLTKRLVTLDPPHLGKRLVIKSIIFCKCLAPLIRLATLEEIQSAKFQELPNTFPPKLLTEFVRAKQRSGQQINLERKVVSSDPAGDKMIIEIPTAFATYVCEQYLSPAKRS